MLRPVMWPSSVWKLQEYKCICSVGITLQLKSYSFGLNVTNFNQNCTILTVEWCRHYKYVCILAHTTLKMVTWVAETCRLALYNKITLTERKWICWSFKGFFFTSDYCTECGTYQKVWLVFWKLSVASIFIPPRLEKWVCFHIHVESARGTAKDPSGPVIETSSFKLGN